MRRAAQLGTIESVDEVITHRDVTTVMGMLGSIEAEVKRIRELLEEEEDGEETPEDDA